MLLETLGSALLGLLGTGLTTYSNYKMEQLRSQNAREKMKLETELMIKEADANIRVAQATASMRIEELESEAFAASVASQEPALPSDWVSTLFEFQGWGRIFTVPIGLVLLFLLGLGDVVQHLMRSFLTLYSLGIASWVTYKCYDIMMSTGVPFPKAGEAWETACETVLLLAVTMVTWWFGDRRVAKHLSHMKGGTK